MHTMNKGWSRRIVITSARDTKDPRGIISPRQTNAVTVIFNYRPLSLLSNDSIFHHRSNACSESGLESAHRHHISSRHQRSRITIIPGQTNAVTVIFNA